MCFCVAVLLTLLGYPNVPLSLIIESNGVSVFKYLLQALFFVNMFAEEMKRQDVNIIVEYSSVKSTDLKSKLRQEISILTAKPKSRQAENIFIATRGNELL